MNTNNTPHTVGHVGWSPDYKSTPKLPAIGELIARRSAAACSGSSAHDKAWEKNFVVPIARTMKERGIGYMVICLQENGKAAYVLEPTPPDSELVEYLIHPQNAEPTHPADTDAR